MSKIKKSKVREICYLLSVICILSSVTGCREEHEASRISVYFNKSVETGFAEQKKAKANIALDKKLIQRIKKAKYSIDCCVYDLGRQNVTNALIKAHKKSVKIRFITDNTNRNNAQVKQLEDAGIKVIDDAFPVNASPSSIMHNKFFVFDYKDTTDKNDDWVWTGSYNITNNGTKKNANNVIEIQDNALAEAFTNEFEEMWGSSSMVPNSEKSRFHRVKTDNINHKFIVDGIEIELYMSPGDSSTKYIKKAIYSADYEIYFCIFAFSRQDISDAMKSLWDTQEPDRTVMGVFDASSWNQQWSKSQDLRGIGRENPWSPPADVFKDNVPNNGKLHHKYMIIDAKHPDSNPIVITGSQNWSNSGERRNDENTLIIHDARIANLYFQEFMARYKEVGKELWAGIYNTTE